MERLIIDHQLRKSNKATSEDSDEAHEARVVAQAETLAVLEGESDPTRKRILLLFLYDSALIDNGKPILTLARANLSSVDMTEARLKGANLTEANLSGADLSRANLSAAHLSAAQLIAADLAAANLRGASLLAADLRRAKNLTQEQINLAYGDEHTKLPDDLQRPAHWSKGDEEASEEDEGGEKR
jgi:uncharacterized protein YjbI with pentapeptide repeats